jgi:hypothetical protein
MSHPTKWPRRLLIFIPCGEFGMSVFWRKLVSRDSKLDYIGWHIDQGLVDPLGGAYIQDAHNQAVEKALNIPDWTHLLWLEYDHEFPENLLEYIAHWPDHPIIAGVYPARKVEAPLPIVYKWNEDRTFIQTLQPYELAPMFEKPGLHKVDVVPMGCTMIRRDVFEKWPEDIPCYAVATNKKRTGGVMGDDVWFCRHAQDQGYDIYVDTNLAVGHYGLLPYTMQLYIAWVAQQKRLGKTNKIEVKA